MKLLIAMMALFVLALAGCAPAAMTGGPVALAAPSPAATVEGLALGAETRTPLAAAAPAASAGGIPEIEIDAADFSYKAPETLAAGWTRVNLKNTGAEPHHVQFMLLNDGVSLQQFQEAFKQGEGPALALVKQVGGVGALHPGGKASAVLNPPAGNYVIQCFIPSPTDHIPHAAKGMIKPLTVQPGNSAAAPPKADLTVHLKDFAFDLPDTLPSGPLTIEVVNQGPEPHEFNILRLADGETVGDAVQFMTGGGGPPPFAAVGGVNGLDVGLSAYAELYLEPGKYVAICNIPSPNYEGKRHSALGMIREFEVEASTAAR